MNCILIEDEPLAIRQISQYVNNNSGLKLECVITDMDEFYTSISDFQPRILFLDYCIPGASNIPKVLVLIPKNTIIVITSVLPLIVFPKIEDHLLKFKYVELNKPFSAETFNNCINRIIDGL
ncbi:MULTISPECIES: hypothetical protein [unclassified Sphingobacterium]|uniref:hypothetical protein n=1 Tax=unclassified Sphingobacterium TaxID=2609468 RepID=UPI0029556D2E|nr:hypothetical protein [Sphingobacterium sp. UGAL515B_05]WON96654.1 hypothetical protein OK025_09645 [Sphingobacterium sp. UGAL515B_05]